jgi:type II secretory pathway component PulF
VYVSIIQAGEASGELDTVLKRLSDMLQGEAALRKKVIAAMVYPIAVIFIAILVMTAMFIWVIPTFSDMYAKMGIKLPLITQVMVGISDFIRNFWYAAVALVGGGVFGFQKFSQSAYGKEFIDKTVLHIPVVAPLVRAVTSSHFISTLNVSFSAGLPITDCIFMACNTVTNVILNRLFSDANLKIQSGQRLAAAMADTGVLPSMIIIMISTGEEAGSLDTMLKFCLEHLEDEVNQRVEVLMSMMEPVLLILLGFMVLAMALSIYLPLFSMYEHIGGN